MKKRIFLLAFFLLGFFPSVFFVFADRTILYEGRLLDSQSNPIQTPQYFRFSLWGSADFVSESISEEGLLNASAGSFLGWQEEHLITPNHNGTFSVELGHSASLPDFSLDTDRFLQIEVRPESSDIHTYQLLDPTSDNGADTNDRKRISSVPSALFAERAKESASSDFTLDPDDILKEQNSGQIRLRFGNDLDKFLAYDFDRSAFFLNAPLIVSGDLTVHGTINGVAADEVIFQTHIQNTDTGTISPTFQINNIGAGLILDTNGISADRTITFDDANTIVVGTENTQTLKNKTISGNENTIADLSPSSLPVRPQTTSFVPEYASLLVVPDGSDNMISLHSGFDEATQKKFYRFSSQKNTLQDINLKISFVIPDNFVGWQSNTLVINVKSVLRDSLKNHLDLVVNDTAGNSSSLVSNFVPLEAGLWEGKILSFPSGTFEPGKKILIDLKVSVSSGTEFFLGDLTLKYLEQ